MAQPVFFKLLYNMPDPPSLAVKEEDEELIHEHRLHQHWIGYCLYHST